MNRISYIIMAALCAMSVAQLFALRHEASAQTSPTAQSTADAIQAYGFPPTSDPNGGWTPRKDFAAYQWHPGTDIPSRKDGLIVDGERKLLWPILVEQRDGSLTVLYYGKIDPDSVTEVSRWRSRHWATWTPPVRWAYVRLEKEVWNEQMQRMEIPGLGLTKSPPPTNPDDKPGVYMSDTQGQWMVDDLKRSFTTAKIQDFIDASPYDEPDKGAPLE